MLKPELDKPSQPQAAMNHPDALHTSLCSQIEFMPESFHRGLPNVQHYDGVDEMFLLLDVPKIAKFLQQIRLRFCQNIVTPLVLFSSYCV